MSSGSGLQPERTNLAWRRTGLVAVAATLTLVRAAVTRGSLVIAVLSGLLVLGAAVTLRQGVGEGTGGGGGDHDAVVRPVLPLAATVTVVVTVLIGVAGLGLVLST